MDVKFKKNGNALFVYLYGELDEYTVGECRKYLDNLFQQNYNVNKVIFNFSNLSFMDSTGIGMLIGRYKKLKQFGISCYIENAGIDLEKIIEISGLYKIMPKY